MHWLITLLAAASPVAAATFTVTNTNDSGAGSLRDAIAQANASGAVDTIDFDAALSGQTIALSLPSLEITGEDTIDASGLANPVTLDGQDAMRILIVRDSAVGMVFKSLRFVDGRTTSSFSGSAVLNQGFSVFIDCEFVGNRTRDTGDGGAILNQGILWLTRCLLNQNSAGADGGAIYNEDAGTLQTVLKAIDCTFSHNAAGTTSANQGGACYSDANTGSTFIGCTFNNNTASSSGGAIFDAGSLTIINSTFSLNSGIFGGAIRLPSASAGANIIHCTIVSNTATTGDGGGIAIDTTGVTLTNTICYGNNGSSGSSDVDGDITTEGGNLIGVHSTGILTNNGFPILSSDPLLTPAADFGGPTLTMRPSTNSPALNAGDSAALPADVEDLDKNSNSSEPLPIDQRGELRITGSAPDLGAMELSEPVGFEFQAPTTSITETATLQLTATAEMSDGSMNSIPFNEISIDSLTGPIASVDSDGLLTPEAVYEDTGGTVNASWSGDSSDFTLTVVDTNSDNFGIIAGDGVPDDWQVDNFGIANLAESLAGLNPDSDPNNNFDEWLVGTDPNDPSSFFSTILHEVWEDTELGLPVTRVRIGMPTVTTHANYQLYRSDNLGSWSPFNIPFDFTDLSLGPNGIEAELFDLNWFDHQFFRLEATPK